MKIIETLFGEGDHLNTLQMCCRAVVIYFIGLLYIRLAGKRAFGKISTFDHIITITLGAMLSRAIVGASAFLPIVGSSLVLVILHRAVAWFCMQNHKLGALVKGRAESLFQNGRFNEKNMRKNFISRHDAMEGVRIHLNEKSLDKVEEICLERNGELSVIKKEKK